ncbi:MAG: hypothetical protein KF855_11210 [Acidobacteria bacterium]|nr:hypothetical protein [Acidobacteriota bacterium]
MHTQQEIYEQAVILPYEERKNLIRDLEKSLRNGTGTPDIADEIELSVEEREKIVNRLRGIAAVPGKRPPTDEEAKEAYYSYLAEKYK